MKKIVFIVMALFVIFSCEKIEKPHDQEENFHLKSELPNIEYELNELEKIHHFLTDNLNSYFANHGFGEFEDFIDAIIEKDEDELLRYFKLTNDDYEYLKIEIEFLGEEIKRKSKISEEDFDNICLFCLQKEFLEKYQNKNFPKIDLKSYQKDDVDCNWGQFSMSLILCTKTGPVLYWGCAYLALCGHCEGGWVDDICF